MAVERLTMIFEDTYISAIRNYQFKIGGVTIYAVNIGIFGVVLYSGSQQMFS